MTEQNNPLPVKKLPEYVANEWLEIFAESFEEVKEWYGDFEANAAEYLCNHIFGYNTYDGNLDERFCLKTIEVCKCLIEHTTSEYIDARDDDYLNFITIVHMPFLHGRITWGVSIRNSRLTDCKYSSCGIVVNGEQEAGEFEYTSEQFTEFVKGIILFYNKYYLKI